MLFVALVFFAISGAAQESSPQEKKTSLATDFALGAGAVVATLFYSPAKVLYAGLGLVTGSAAYILTGGSATVANRILTPALRGTYVITSKHLTGEERVEFIGKEPPPPKP